MDALDLRVAPGAGSRHVVPVNARPPIGVRQDLVRRVARRADRGHGETLPVQSFAVDGLGVVLEDAILGNVVRTRHGRALVMAFPTKGGDVHHGGGRPFIGV